jgi:hypothetical protein
MTTDTNSPITRRLMDTIDKLRAEVAVVQSSLSAANYRANLAERRLAKASHELAIARAEHSPGCALYWSALKDTRCNCGKVSA